MALMNNSNDKKWIVALVNASAANGTLESSPQNQHSRKDGKSVQLHKRKDPSTGQTRLYAVLEGLKTKDENKTARNRLCEIQVMLPPGLDEDESLYSSFLIQSASNTHVSSNGKLYTITDVDPLFFVLAKNENDKNDNSSKKLQQWQPLDQILEGLDPELRTCLDPQQMPHLFSTMNMSDTESFYKFSMVRALTWLQRKQQTLQAFLLQYNENAKKQQQQQQASSHNRGTTNSAGDAAFSDGFFMPQETTQAASSSSSTQESSNSSSTSSEANDVKAQQVAKEASVQIICSYLNEPWRRRFLEHLELSEHVLETPKQRLAKRARSSADETSATVSAHGSNSSSVTNNDWIHQQAQPPPEKKAKKESAVSAGVKKLAKANIKGMKKMSAFFSVSSSSASTKKENTKKN